MRSSYPVIINVPPSSASSASSSLSSSLASLSLTASPSPSSQDDEVDLELKELALEQKQEENDRSYEQDIGKGCYEKYLWKDVTRNRKSDDEMIPYDEYLKTYVDDPDKVVSEGITEILRDLFPDWGPKHQVVLDYFQNMACDPLFTPLLSHMSS